MLDHFGRTELEELVASEGGPHLTIYMPTHMPAIDTEQDKTRLKNLVQDAERELTEGWMRSGEARSFLEPLTAMVGDQGFWSQRQNGLAFFLSQDRFRVYRLGVEFEERLSISRSYLLRPIIPVIHRNSPGFVLALSEHKVALYQISDQQIHPVTVPGLPESMEKTLHYTSVDRGQQTHAGATSRPGKQGEVFHGQGGKSDAHQDDLRHFFRAVDEAISTQLGNSEHPLILACVDSSVPLYTDINSYNHLHPEHVSGNVDYLQEEELRDRVLPILLAVKTRQRDQIAHRIREHLNTNVASEKAGEVIRGAYQGRIQTLFFEEHAQLEGQFDPVLQSPVVFTDTPKVELHPYNTDLIELTVQQTLRHKGEVYSVAQTDMPGQGPLAALFRY